MTFANTASGHAGPGRGGQGVLHGDPRPLHGDWRQHREHSGNHLRSTEYFFKLLAIDMYRADLVVKKCFILNFINFLVIFSYLGLKWPKYFFLFRHEHSMYV